MQKNVLITGGNSGIGYATARLFKEKGYSVTIVGRNPQRVELAAAELAVNSITGDMALLDDIKKIADSFREDGLDVLVNNAAIARFMPLFLHTTADYEEFFNTNIRGPMELIKGLLPALEKRQGSVINVSSAVVRHGGPTVSLYAATKGAVDAFTRSLAHELAPRGIRINAVSPGAIDTPIFTKVGLSPEAIQAVRQHHEATIPMHRYGLPEEVAQVILAQAEATYVTGAIWSVDGGVDA
ncbi:MAG: hypothetical protein A2521_16015 [Deltaproteobacteria bacterium RIFOXYD12_FULL_57_12]|nr:MAG: hypothetical protein A2521_16015 [Deltaproteobacteria bacterium RIFOXYD12_FULL_57_12]